MKVFYSIGNALGILLGITLIPFRLCGFLLLSPFIVSGYFCGVICKAFTEGWRVGKGDLS